MSQKKGVFMGKTVRWVKISRLVDKVLIGNLPPGYIFAGHKHIDGLNVNKMQPNKNDNSNHMKTKPIIRIIDTALLLQITTAALITIIGQTVNTRLYRCLT